jgi:Mor family transcriptional regulator
MTEQELRNQIQTEITGQEGNANSITPTITGGVLDALLDYIAQQAPVKTSGVVSIGASQALLEFDINAVNFSGGSACYLPTTTVVGKEIIVTAFSNNMQVFANVENTASMFNLVNATVTNVIILTNETYRFTRISASGQFFWRSEKF